MQSEAAVKNILASYSANVKQVFPWFNDETPLAHYEPIEADLVQCYGDHFYAAKTKVRFFCRFLFLTEEKRLVMPPGSQLVLTPTLALPFLR